MDNSRKESKIVTMLGPDGAVHPAFGGTKNGLPEGDMLDSALETGDHDSPGFVEVLTVGVHDPPFGFKIGGTIAGPTVLVAGHDPLTTMVYDRLLRLPTIHWMRGSLTLVCLNAFDEAAVPFRFLSISDQRPDELFFLPSAYDEKFQEAAAKEGYWAVLRLCASLGMISGRGIPVNTTMST